MEVFKEDIWISSFPKCGTTWTQEMVWNIVNDLDFEKAKSEKLDERIPFFEMTAITEDRHFDNFTAEERSVNATLVASVDLCKGLTTRPRIFKTHLDFEFRNILFSLRLVCVAFRSDCVNPTRLRLLKKCLTA